MLEHYGLTVTPLTYLSFATAIFVTYAAFYNIKTMVNFAVAGPPKSYLIPMLVVLVVVCLLMAAINIFCAINGMHIAFERHHLQVLQDAARQAAPLPSIEP